MTTPDESLDIVAGKIGAFLQRSDDQRLSAALLLAQAKSRLDAGEPIIDEATGAPAIDPWGYFCRKIRRRDGSAVSDREIRRLVAIGSASNPEAALAEEREKARIGMREGRERAAAKVRPSEPLDLAKASLEEQPAASFATVQQDVLKWWPGASETDRARFVEFVQSLPIEVETACEPGPAEPEIAASTIEPDAAGPAAEIVVPAHEPDSGEIETNGEDTEPEVAASPPRHDAVEPAVEAEIVAPTDEIDPGEIAISDHDTEPEIAASTPEPEAAEPATGPEIVAPTDELDPGEIAISDHDTEPEIAASTPEPEAAEPATGPEIVAPTDELDPGEIAISDHDTEPEIAASTPEPEAAEPAPEPEIVEPTCELDPGEIGISDENKAALDPITARDTPRCGPRWRAERGIDEDTVDRQIVTSTPKPEAEEPPAEPEMVEPTRERAPGEIEIDDEDRAVLDRIASHDKRWCGPDWRAAQGINEGKVCRLLAARRLERDPTTRDRLNVGLPQ